ncbi:MAG: DNA polymerase III subunit epsilon [Burkholderiales bacterium]|nr:DNA polymerase III subunit epsilon [Burkholderiales bacterium]
MRRIVLDTETTGLDHTLGHRVVEIGCVELDGRRATGRTFHQYLAPGRACDPGAVEVHGLTDEFLAGQPPFVDIAERFVEFVEGAELLIHNAAFDVGFLDMELALAGRPPLERIVDRVTDTLKLARSLYPGKRNSLDALCDRHGVDRASRQFHGALLDSQLLAEVWLAMTRGQGDLAIVAADPGRSAAVVAGTPKGPRTFVVRHANAAERAAHAALVDDIDRASRGHALWRRVDADTAAAAD